jgi:HEAT repeat protein
MAVEALGEMGSEGKVAEMLTPALEDRDVSVRLAAEEALARGGKGMVPDLITALKSDSAKVRAGVARALGMIGPPAKEAIKPLVALKNDKDANVKAAALEALLRIFNGKEDEMKKALGLLELREKLEWIESESRDQGEAIWRIRRRLIIELTREERFRQATGE